MCEANAYLWHDGKEEIFMESVDKLVPEGQMLMLQDIFGEKKFIQARIRELALVEHKIVLEERM